MTSAWDCVVGIVIAGRFSVVTAAYTKGVRHMMSAAAKRGSIRVDVYFPQDYPVTVSIAEEQRLFACNE